MPAPGDETLAEQILADVQTACALPDGITYYFSVGTGNITRKGVGMPSISGGPFPFVAISLLGNRADEDSMTGGSELIMEEMDLDIEVWVKDISLSVPTVVQRLEHDFRKALRQDVTRGGPAKYTEFVDTEAFYPTDGEPYAGCSIKFRITYETNQSDLTATIGA